MRLPNRAKIRHHLLTRFHKINHQILHCLAVYRLENSLSLWAELIPSCISRLLEMLASNVIFLWQVFHCHLQSSYSKLYLSATYMFYSVFCSIKISFKPYLIHISYGIASHLTFLLIILSYKNVIYTFHHMHYHINMMLMTWFGNLFRT